MGIFKKLKMIIDRNPYGFEGEELAQLKQARKNDKERRKKAMKAEKDPEHVFNNMEPGRLLVEIEDDWEKLRYLDNPSRAVCNLALEQSPMALKFIKDQEDYMCFSAVLRDWRALEFVKNQTEELCKMAIDKSEDALALIRDDNLRREMTEYFKYITEEKRKLVELSTESSKVFKEAFTEKMKDDVGKMEVFR